MNGARGGVPAALLFAAAVGVGMPARAGVRGRITGAGAQRLAVAVSPLKDLGGDAGGRLGRRFADVLSRDLTLSGYFRVIDRGAYLEDPQQSGITVGEIDFGSWSLIGAQGLVKGGIAVADGRVTVEARLFDVVARQEVGGVGTRFRGTRADVPRMAHKFADTILEVLTGERGPFDSWIVFTRRRGGPFKQLYLFTFDGGEPKPLWGERSVLVAPSWHPDAHAVLFTSYRRHQPGLFELLLPSRRLRSLSPPGAKDLGGRWSPDGRYLAVAREVEGNVDLYLLDRSGRVLRRLTTHWGIDVSPTWSPDGRQIAFTSNRAGTPQVYVINADGSGGRRISHGGSYNTSPAWSPKGDLIAYAARRAGRFQIMVVDPFGREARQVTTIGSNEDPSWAPDGRYLVYSSLRAGHRVLAMTDRDGRMEHQLTRGGGDDTSPAWSPRLDRAGE